MVMKGERQMKDKKSAKRTINLRGIDENLHRSLRILAALKGVTLKDLIVKILEDYLEGQPGFESLGRKEDAK